MLLYVDVVLRLVASILAKQNLLYHDRPQPTPTLKVASFYAPSPATSYNLNGSTYGPTLDVPLDGVLVLVLATLLLASFTLSAVWMKQAVKSHHQQQTTTTAIVLHPHVLPVARLGGLVAPPLTPPPELQAFVSYLYRRTRSIVSRPPAMQISTSPLNTIPWHDLLAIAYVRSTLTWLGRLPPALTARLLHVLILDEALMADISATFSRLSPSGFDIEIQFVPSIHTRGDSFHLVAPKAIDHHDLEYAFVSEAKDASEEHFSLNEQANRQGVCDPQDEGSEHLDFVAEERNAPNQTQDNGCHEARRWRRTRAEFLLEHAPPVDLSQSIVNRYSKRHGTTTPRGRAQTRIEQEARRSRSVQANLYPDWQSFPGRDEGSEPSSGSANGRPTPVITELDIYAFSDPRRSKSCSPTDRNQVSAGTSPSCLVPDDWVPARREIDAYKRAMQLQDLLKRASELRNLWPYVWLLLLKAMWDMARMPTTEESASASRCDSSRRAVDRSSPPTHTSLPRSTPWQARAHMRRPLFVRPSFVPTRYIAGKRNLPLPHPAQYNSPGRFTSFDGPWFGSGHQSMRSARSGFPPYRPRYAVEGPFANGPMYQRPPNFYASMPSNPPPRMQIRPDLRMPVAFNPRVPYELQQAIPPNMMYDASGLYMPRPLQGQCFPQAHGPVSTSAQPHIYPAQFNRTQTHF